MPEPPFPSADPWLPPMIEQAEPVPAPAGRAPRAPGLRVAVGVIAAVAVVVLSSIGPWGPPGPGYLHPDRHVDLTSAPGSLLALAVLWFVLPRVSYRRRDVLLLLVPIYGLWVVGLAFYRLAALPYRDWRPRDDERPRVAPVEGSDRYYVLTDDGRPAPPVDTVEP